MAQPVSFEYCSHATVSAEQLAEIRVAMATNASYGVLPGVDERRVGLTLSVGSADAPREDVTIVFGDTVYVAIHFGTRTERAALLGWLTGLLSRHGIATTFEEL